MRTALMCASLAIAVLTAFACSKRAAAQEIELGGRAFVDYFYTLSSAEEDDEGLHGFTYRRLYLTSDFLLTEDFYGRARLEANDGTIGPSGPEPFVKDLWVAWQYAGEHTAILGVTPPPAFEVAEDVWGYRSLEQTSRAFQNVNRSRDFGVRFNGPLSDRFQYAFMLANNSGVNPESDDYKRVYGQLDFYPTENVVFTAGADHAGYDDARDAATRASVFGGYRSNDFNMGLEGYWQQTTFDVGDHARSLGASLFARYSVGTFWELIGRLDAVSEEFGGEAVTENFLLLGVAYQPNEYVSIIPNLWLFDSDATDDAEALGRVTVDVRF